MKKLCLILLTLLPITMCTKFNKGQKLLIETSKGNIKVILYEDTPLHRDNFIKLANEGYYENLTFHRIIQSFMIQGGDVSAGKDSTFHKEDVIDAEFRIPQHFHKAGALAAARWGDEENPDKKSDAFQFYIVSGKPVFEHDIKKLEKERFERLKQRIYQEMQSAAMDTIKAMYREGNKAALAEFRASIVEKADAEAERRKGEVLFTDVQKETYYSVGGAPHLDGEYTVFGEVIEGLDIVKQIEKVDVNMNNKPLSPVIINKISLID